MDQHIVEAILDKLDIEVTNVDGDELEALCPGHKMRTGKADRNPSWSLNTETLEHHCWSCGYGGTLQWLVAVKHDLRDAQGDPDIVAAGRWLRQVAGENLDKVVERMQETRRRSYIGEHRLPEMTEARLALFTAPPDKALRDRQLTAQGCAELGILWDPAEEAWITPVRDPHTGKLWGWQTKAHDGRFFRNRPQGIRKGEALFGWNAYCGGRLIVVESPLDAGRLQSLGIPGATATYGALVSDTQLKLIASADDVVFALDNPYTDPAGRKSAMNVLAAARQLRLEFRFFRYQRDWRKDPGELTEAQVFEGLAEARHCVRGTKAILDDDVSRNPLAVPARSSRPHGRTRRGAGRL